MRLLEEGLEYRSWPRRAVLRFDEMEALEGAKLQARGRRFRLPPAVAPVVARELESPPLPSDLSGLRTWAEALLQRPHGPQRAAQRLLAAASAVGASDLHLESDGEGWVLRVRLSGELTVLCGLTASRGARLLAALKGMAGVLPYRGDILQEGRIARCGQRADVRASFVPTAMGERAVLRLFGQLLQLEAVGLPLPVRIALEASLTQRTGLILVAGATGAGKTTTLYAALAHLATVRPGAHLSLEDPVEQRLRAAGIAVDQIELDPARGLTAEALLAATLRQDIDVLSVGELRTPQEAQLALQASHTGRLVLAGVHAGSAGEANQRMLDLGVEPALLRGALRGTLWQRLDTVPCGCARGCPDCRGTTRRRRLEAQFLEGSGA